MAAEVGDELAWRLQIDGGSVCHFSDFGAIDADDEQAKPTARNVASAEFLVTFEIRTANTYQPCRTS